MTTTMNKKFRVRMGLHIEGDTTYKKGDVIVSDRDLCATFPQKFDDLGPAKEETAPQAKDIPSQETSGTFPPRKKSKGKKPAVPGTDDWADT